MVIFIFIYISFVLYLFVGWNYLNNQPRKKQNQPLPEVAIVLPIRNEEEHIVRLLGDLQKQAYSLFQLIIVDDYSKDETIQKIESFRKDAIMKIELIKLSDIYPAEFSETNNKKLAITEGVKSAHGELIVCIDGDIQMEEKWLQSMISYYQNNEVVFYNGAVLYTKQEGFFGKFLETDQINNIATTVAALNWKNPAMANGANMAFRKAAWEEVGGYEGITSYASGDDMMLLHRMAAKYPDKIGFNNSEEAIVFTSPVDSLSGFIHQRVRWFGKIFQFEHKQSIWIMILGLILNGFVVYHMFTFPFHPLRSMNILLVKMLSDTIFLTPPIYYFKRSSYLVLLPLFSLLFSLYIVIIALITPFVKYRWKEV